MPRVLLTENQKAALARGLHAKRSVKLTVQPNQMIAVPSAAHLPLTKPQWAAFERAKALGRAYTVTLKPTQLQQLGGFLGPLLQALKALVPAVSAALPSLAMSAAQSAVGTAASSLAKRVFGGDDKKGEGIRSSALKLQGDVIPGMPVSSRPPSMPLPSVRGDPMVTNVFRTAERTPTLYVPRSITDVPVANVIKPFPRPI